MFPLTDDFFDGAGYDPVELEFDDDVENLGVADDEDVAEAGSTRSATRQTVRQAVNCTAGRLQLRELGLHVGELRFERLLLGVHRIGELRLLRLKRGQLRVEAVVNGRESACLRVGQLVHESIEL